MGSQAQPLVQRMGGGRGNPPVSTSAAPSTPTVDWQHDPDFDALPIQEKHKALMSIDPDYASLPAPEQAKALQSIHTRHQMPEQPAQQRGFFGTLSDKISAAGKSLLPKTPADVLEYAVPGSRELVGAYNTGKEMYRQATRPLPDYIKSQQAFPRSYRAATTLSPLVPFLDPEAQERASQSGNTGALAAEIATPLAFLASTEAIGHGLPIARQSLAERMYTPEGELVPGAKALAHPTQLPEYALKKTFPEPAEAVARREQGAAYEQKGQDLMKRGREQDVLDRKQRLSDRMAAKNQPKPSFSVQGPTSTTTSSPSFSGQLPSPGAGEVSTTGTAPTDVKLSDRMTKTSPTPPQGRGKIITDPNAPFKTRVTLVSVPWDDLKAGALKGDPKYIDEVYRRGREAEIPNIGLVRERGTTLPHRELTQRVRK